MSVVGCQNNSKSESYVEFTHINVFNNFPIPKNVDEVESTSTHVSFEIKKDHEIINNTYIRQLLKDGWTMTAVNFGKTYFISKEENSYLLIITKTNNESITSITIKTR
ncbi:hypothetical protein VQL36_05015 [Chengkuizengella sp. SCS-71B]|uniref:hypothetical protein n=1 Tax=Chengkuizengella sp. SCS-71B TaxID=3115290 RepID=UPI0032C22A38